MLIKRNFLGKVKWCCPKCDYCTHDGKRLLGHLKRQHNIDGELDSSCRFCSKTFLNRRSRTGHETCCNQNPLAEARHKSISIARIGNALSQEHKQSISKTVRKRINEGTWHNSLASHRKHRYRDEVFDGEWELKFAQWMDARDIPWERNKRVFSYVFENIERSYTPDFYLPCADCFVEIKGYKTEKDVAKWLQFPDRLLVLRGSNLVRMGINIDVRDREGKYD